MKPLALVGPTASGKTVASLQLASSFDIEIISMDSMAVYTDIPILAAVPSVQDRQLCKHHLVECIDPETTWTVADWLDEAVKLVAEIQDRGHRPVFVGGTFFYLKALREGLDQMPPADDNLRSQYQNLFDQQGPKALHDQLAQVDPDVAAILHPNDFRRVSRALEVATLTGLRRSQREATRNGPVVEVELVLWDWPREELYVRSDKRVDSMIDRGLVDEIRALQDRRVGHTIRQAVGFDEMRAHLRGDLTIELALEQMKKRTRHLAKHQQTWMRGFEGHRIDGSIKSSLAELTTVMKASL